MRSLFIYIFLLLFVVRVDATETVPAGSGHTVIAGIGKKVKAGSGTGRWQSFDTTDGLANVNVAEIYQDRDGHLWFGTEKGVSRYDGQTWSTLPLSNGFVRAIFQDTDNIFWFVTSNRVTLYNPSNQQESFEPLTLKDDLIGDGILDALRDRDGYLWVSTLGKGVIRYDPSAEFMPSKAEELGTGSQTFKAFTTQDGLANNIVTTMIQDRDGYLWFVTDDGVSRFDPSSESFTNFSVKDSMPHRNVQTVFQDRDGDLWFGTYGGGVSRYDGETFTTYTTDDGLGSNIVKSILQDNKGYLWFATQGGGVSRLDPSASLGTGSQTFTTFTTKHGLVSNTVISMLQDNEGNLWFGTYGGTSRYDNRS